MNSKQNFRQWTAVTLLLALTSLTTMGFTVVDRESRAATISADHIMCALLPQETFASIPEDLHGRLCADHSVDMSPSLGPVLDSTASFAQYSAALERTELAWNQQTRTYGGDWFAVYGNASGITELELANPEFANR